MTRTSTEAWSLKPSSSGMTTAQAVKRAPISCRRAEKEGANEEAPPVEVLDMRKPKEEQDDDKDINIWHMEPEELFSWNGFPDLDLRGLVRKMRGCSD